MDSRIRQSVGPIYLVLCLLLGGSAQGIWANMVLELIGVAMLAWAAIGPNEEPAFPSQRPLLFIALLAVALVAIQLIPLPSAVWTHLAGRGVIADDFRGAGLALPALPLSLAPYRSFDALLGLIPPLALFCVIARMSAYRPSWLVAALTAGTIAGILVGALQVSSADFATSRWYFYAESSFGIATGFFANGNHMGMLLVSTVPFLAALLASARGSNRQRSSAIFLVLGCAAVLVLAGIALNRSLAAYGLALPVLAASTLLLIPQRSKARPLVLIAAALLLAGAMFALGKSSVGSGSEAATSVQTRQEMLRTTGKAIGDFMPWGSGLGSFRNVYHLYEDRAHVTNVYVIHAHNDYAELALETGFAGIILMIAFLGWWGRAVWIAWSYSEAGPYARAASIASAAILAHSIVDFPLRTAAIAAVFAMGLALLAERRVPVARASDDLWPTRHRVLR